MSGCKRIRGGPSKFDLMLSLFAGGNVGVTRQTVVFVLEASEDESSVIVHIESVEREDGSGESWNFEGYRNQNRVRGYYNSRNRTGTLIVEK